MALAIKHTTNHNDEIQCSPIAINSTRDDVEKFKLFKHKARKTTATNNKLCTMAMAAAVAATNKPLKPKKEGNSCAREPQHDRKHSHLRSRGALHLFGQTLYRHTHTNCAATRFIKSCFVCCSYWHCKTECVSHSNHLHHLRPDCCLLPSHSFTHHTQKRGRAQAIHQKFASSIRRQ